MQINTNKQNRDVYTATVDGDEVLDIISERVAERAGISLDGCGVTWRAYVSSRDTGTGIKYDVKVEIVDDHTRKPQAG